MVKTRLFDVFCETNGRVSRLTASMLPDLPLGWIRKSLGHLMTFKNGLNKEKEYFGRGTPIINYMDVFMRPGLKAVDIKGSVELSSSEIKNFATRAGDVFFTRTSETLEEVGMASVLLETIPNAVFSGFVLRGRSISNDLDNGFKKYCFRSDLVRKQIVSKGTYTTRALINGKALSDVFLAFPKDKKEQIAIAEVLSDVDASIESLEELVAKKRLIKQGVLQELLSGERRLPGFYEERKTHKLGEFGICLRGVSYDGNVDLYQSNNQNAVILLRANNIKLARINFTDIQYVNKVRVSDSQYLNMDDIVICMANGSKKLIGKSAFYNFNDNKCTFGAFMGCFRTFDKEQAIPKYIFYLLSSNEYRKQVDILLAGSSINNLTPRSIEGILFPFPCVKEQLAISEILSDMDDEILTLEKKLAKSCQIKKSMTQDLLTGKVRLI